MNRKLTFKDGFKAGLGFYAAQLLIGIIGITVIGLMFLVIVLSQ